MIKKYVLSQSQVSLSTRDGGNCVDNSNPMDYCQKNYFLVARSVTRDCGELKDLKAMVAQSRTPVTPIGQIPVSSLPEAYQHCFPIFMDLLLGKGREVRAQPTKENKPSEGSMLQAFLNFLLLCTNIYICTDLSPMGYWWTC